MHDFIEGINDNFKEGNEGINDLISASREMNYQLNYGREMIIKLRPTTAYVLIIYSTYLCTEIIKVVVYCKLHNMMVSFD